jgi:hypothetical protein
VCHRAQVEVKDNFAELFLSFDVYVGPESRTQVAKLVLQALLSPEPSHQKILFLERSLSSTQQTSDLTVAGFSFFFFFKIYLLLYVSTL